MNMPWNLSLSLFLLLKLSLSLTHTHTHTHTHTLTHTHTHTHTLHIDTQIHASRQFTDISSDIPTSFYPHISHLIPFPLFQCLFHFLCHTHTHTHTHSQTNTHTHMVCGS